VHAFYVMARAVSVCDMCPEHALNTCLVRARGTQARVDTRRHAPARASEYASGMSASAKTARLFADAGMCDVGKSCWCHRIQYWNENALLSLL